MDPTQANVLSIDVLQRFRVALIRCQEELSLALAEHFAGMAGEGAGTVLECLFIDEGFGSLDQDTIYQVLDQLDHLRSGRRVVGVISHVGALRERIRTGIEVTSTDRGSSVRLGIVSAA